MLRPTILVKVSVAALVVFLAAGAEAMGQFSDSQRRSIGNLDPNPPRRSMGNFPPGQPNYDSSPRRRSSDSQGQSSGGATVVVPNPYYPGWYYPPVPAYRAPVYSPYGRVYVPAPGYYYAPGYYPYYYYPGYVVPRYPYAF